MFLYILFGALGALILASIIFVLLSTKNREERSQLRERIEDLRCALNKISESSADRRNALNEKTKKIFDLEFKLMNQERELDKEKDKYTNLLHQKKSTEVRIGQISEQIAPFLHAWPYKAGNFRFLGAPIDGISFEDDKVVFVEIKTGKGRLSPKQIKIRKQIRDKKIEWVEFRINPDGYNVKEG